jgi:hypothetical protein
MNPVPEDVKDMILDSSSGLSYTLGTDLFLHSLPESPDELICLLGTTGFEPESYDLFYPGFQVLVRGTKGDYATPYATAETIFDFLRLKKNVSCNGAKYLSFIASTDILPLGEDYQGRYSFSLNFIVTRG